MQRKPGEFREQIVAKHPLRVVDEMSIEFLPMSVLDNTAYMNIRQQESLGLSAGEAGGFF
jgi:hypothetical protein